MSRTLIGRLETLLAELGAVERKEVAGLTRPARKRALELWRAAGADADAEALAACAYLGEMLGGLSLVHEWRPAEIETLVGSLTRATGRSAGAISAQVYGEALRSLQGAGLPPRLTLETCLHVLAAFAPVSEASLWIKDSTGAPRCLALVGAAAATRRVRASARQSLTGGARADAARGFVHGIPVLRWDQPCGALVVRARPADRRTALARAAELALVLASVLERDLLLEQSSVRERALLAAGERRLARLGFDIHDGPLQDLAALGLELNLVTGQLARDLPADPSRELVLGRLGDALTVLAGLDRELRELAQSLERRSIVQQPFAEVLRRQVAAFTDRGGASVGLELRGNLEPLSRSQRLALLAVVREALTNVRDHSRATDVKISVSAGRAHTDVAVRDNGRGFDVESTLARAARRGRLGLVGMHERIHLLGGLMRIESRPGGPTTLSVTVPRWEPLTESSGSRVA